MTHPTNDSPASVEEIDKENNESSYSTLSGEREINPAPSEAVEKILDKFGTMAIVTYQKDGSGEPNYKKEKAEAAARINQLLTEARIDELKDLLPRIDHLSPAEILERIAKLEAALKDGGTR